MTDDKTIQYLEDQRDDLVDQNFIGAEEQELNRSNYYTLGRSNLKQEINNTRIKMGLEPLRV